MQAGIRRKPANGYPRKNLLTSQTRIEQIVQITAIVTLVLGCLLVLRPFVTAILWAAILCFATWPLHRRLEDALRGRRVLAALIMTLLLILLMVLPLVLVGATLADNASALVQNLRGVLQEGLHEPPSWLAGLPLVGESVESYWKELAASKEKFMSLVQSLLRPTRDYLLKGGLSLGEGVLQLSLSTFIAFFFYRDGDDLVRSFRSGVDRISGGRTQQLVETVGGTVKSVVFGLLGTALAQGGLAFIGFAIAGVPGSLLLGIITFLLSLVPMGPPLIWVPVTLWLFWQDAVGWGIFMLVWGVFVISGVDNVIKPYLISRGSNLSFLLVFLGVLGGVVAFGFIGLFLGPTLLAVGITLAREWTAATEPAAK